MNEKWLMKLMNIMGVIAMIDNRLRVILAERYLRASKVSAETGIAKSTLSKLINNKTTSFQYGTLNTLCKYLNVTPGELLVYKEDD